MRLPSPSETDSSSGQERSPLEALPFTDGEIAGKRAEKRPQPTERPPINSKTEDMIVTVDNWDSIKDNIAGLNLTEELALLEFETEELEFEDIGFEVEDISLPLPGIDEAINKIILK